MNNRFNFFQNEQDKQPKKTNKHKNDFDYLIFIKKVEKEDIKLLSIGLPGKDDTMHYMRPWKL